jgi:hypothetical protein
LEESGRLNNAAIMFNGSSKESYRNGIEEIDRVLSKLKAIRKWEKGQEEQQ